MADIYEEISRIANSDKKAALCTIINTKGSTPRKVGAKMIVYQDGSIKGTIGGGDLEKKVFSPKVSSMFTCAVLHGRHVIILDSNAIT